MSTSRGLAAKPSLVVAALVVVAMLGGVAPAVLFAGTSSPIRLISRDSRAVEFEYLPGPGTPASGTDGRGAASWLVFDDVVTTDDPGAPIVPLHTERVIIPEGATYHVEFSIESATTLLGLRFPTMPMPPERQNAHGPQGPVMESPLPPDQDRLYPDAPVSWSVEEFRGHKILLVTLAPVQFNPAAGTTQLASAIHVRITFSGGAADGRGAGNGSPATSRDGINAGLSTGREDVDPLVSALVLNPEAASAVRSTVVPNRSGTGRTAGRFDPAPAGNAAAGIPPVYFGNAPQWVKLRIKQNGFYRVTGADLSAAGVSIASIDPATIRLFSGSGLPLSETKSESQVPAWGDNGGFREIGRTVHDGATAARLDPADEILFYGLGPDNFMSWYDASLPDTWAENEHTDANVVWVTWGGDFPQPPVEIPDQDFTGSGDSILVTTVQDLVHVERNSGSEFDPAPYEPGVRWEKWWWQLIDDTRPATFWDVDLPDVDTSRPASMFVRWWGADWPRDDPADPDRTHFLNMTVNDTLITTQWTGGFKRHDMTVDNFGVRARNRIMALVPRIGTNPIRVDQIYLAWFEFTYWKRLSLSRNTLWFKEASLLPANREYRIASAAQGAAAYDVTDPGRPMRMTGSIVMDGTQTLVFHGLDAERRYAAVNPAGFLSPASIAIDARPSHWLRATDEAADYIIIAYDDFLPAAQILADWRRTHLVGITESRPARVSVVRVSDIYDEFSGGLVDPTAIRNFIQYVFYNWAPETPDRLSYVCLLGDASRDTRDRQQTGVPNLIPTWQGGLDYALLIQAPGAFDQYSSDDFFGRLEGPDDRFTDIVIGRIPVVSELQSRQTVRDKIVHSEQFPGFNPDRNRAILVADDVCQIGHPDPLTTTHMEQTEIVSRSIPTCFDLKKIYLYEWGEYDCSVILKPQAKRELIRSMNEGGFLVNYIGHGSDQQLADERVLESADVTTLDNRDQLPILVAASCSVGKFDRPEADGLAEALVKTPTGGCLATMAATHLSVSGENGDLNPMIMRNLFPENSNRSVPVGKALLEAKLQHLRANAYCSAGFGCDREKKYLTLGDPGSIIIAPRRNVRFIDMPDTLRRGSVVTVTGEVMTDAGEADATFQGTIDLLVQDQPIAKIARRNAYDTIATTYLMPGAVIFTGKVPVESGRFTSTFVVPLSLRGGKGGRVRAYAANALTDASGADSVVIGGLSSAVADTVPPTITVTLPGGLPAPGQELLATIEDASGINLTQLFQFRSIQLVVDDDTGTERYRSDVTSSFSYDAGSYTRGQVRMTVPDLPAGHYQVHVVATDNFNNRGQGSLAIDISGAGAGAALSQLFGLPNPFRESTQISWALTEPGSVRLAIYSVSGRKVREWSVDGLSGENRVAWDGADERGDAVANGVYLVRVAFKPAGGGKTRDLVEPIVRVR